MKKYLQTYKLSIQKALTYRSIEVIWIISAFITPLVFMVLWSRNTGQSLLEFSKSEIISYYFILTFISQLVSPHIDWNVADDINNGSLSFYLIKPYTYFIQLFVQELGWKTVSMIFLVLPLMLFSLLFRNSLVIPSMSIIKLLSVISLCMVSYILIFLVQYFMGMLAFWVTQIRSFFRIFYMSSDLFAGKFFPLVLMPSVLKFVGRYLPFQYFWYFPTMVILGKQNLIGLKTSLIIMFSWIFVLIVLIRLIWNKGIKSYSSYGG